MKKVLLGIITLTVLASVVFSVKGIVGEHPKNNTSNVYAASTEDAKNLTLVERLKKNGLSNEDIDNVEEIMIAKGQPSQIIISYYKQTGSWEETRKKFGVSVESHKVFLDSHQKIKQILNIPNNISVEMDAAGYTNSQKQDLIFWASNQQLDITVVWDEIKKGKTKDEIYADKKAKKDEENTLHTKIVTEEIPADVDSISKITTLDKTKISEVLKFAIEHRKSLRERLIKTYNITIEDIALCKDYDAKKITDIASAKQISISNKVTLQRVLELKKTNNTWSDVNLALGGTQMP